MKILFLLCLFILSVSANEQLDVSEIEKQLNQIYKNSELPGFSVSVVSPDEVLFQKSFGYANLKTKEPYTNDTTQIIGSVSKTLLAVSLQSLVDQKLINLKADINSYLPFKVIHSHYPNKKITVQQLANHTSGIYDTDVYFRNFIFEDGENLTPDDFVGDYKHYLKYTSISKTMTKTQFLKNILSKNGEWYNPKFFNNNKPGKKYSYSNLGANLVSLIIEQVTNMKYEEYVEKTILKPLNMNNSGWTQDQLDNSTFATLYFNKDLPVPQYELIAKADGGLLSTTNDLSKFMIEVMNGYFGKGKLLSKKSYLNMFKKKNNHSEHGLFWFNHHNWLFSHFGIEPGATSQFYFYVNEKIGIIFNTNISNDSVLSVNKSINDIWRILISFFIKNKNSK